MRTVWAFLHLVVGALCYFGGILYLRDADLIPAMPFDGFWGEVLFNTGHILIAGLLVAWPLFRFVVELLSMGGRAPQERPGGYIAYEISNGPKIFSAILFFGLFGCVMFAHFQGAERAVTLILGGLGLVAGLALAWTANAELRDYGDTVEIPDRYFAKRKSFDWDSIRSIQDVPQSYDWVLDFGNQGKARVSYFYTGVNDLIATAHHWCHANSKDEDRADEIARPIPAAEAEPAIIRRS